MTHRHSVTGPTLTSELDAVLCEEARILLWRFRESRPLDYSFVELRDFVVPNQEAFSGIEEWDRLAAHLPVCDLCRGLRQTL